MITGEVIPVHARTDGEAERAVPAAMATRRVGSGERSPRRPPPTRASAGPSDRRRILRARETVAGRGLGTASAGEPVRWRALLRRVAAPTCASGRLVRAVLTRPRVSADPACGTPEHPDAVPFKGVTAGESA